MAAYTSINLAWDEVTKCLSNITFHTDDDDGRDARFKPAMEFLQDQGLETLVTEWFMETFQQDLQSRIAPNFWSTFKIDDTSSTTLCLDCLTRGINILHSSLIPYTNSLNLLTGYLSIEGQDLKERFDVLVKALLFYRTPMHFSEVVKTVYSSVFKAFSDSDVKNERIRTSDDSEMDMDESTDIEKDDDEEELEEGRDSEHTLAPSHSDTLSAFHQINAQLYSLGLLERVCGEPVTSIIHQKIKHHVDQQCAGEFETSFISLLESWLDNKVMGWLHLVFFGKNAERPQSPVLSQSLQQWKERLQYYLYQTLAELRIQELFNIIVEFPDSMSALNDLKSCLEKTDLRKKLVQSLRSAFENRLLHPGVNTTDILTQYISSIRALRVLDPSGIVLELVCEPIRKYLRTREDTVRCIVSSLTDDNSNELADELVKAQPVNVEDGASTGTEEANPYDWQPDPIDADPSQTSKSRRTSDIISTLVNIYGSRELFVNEYRNLLADRILSSFSYDTARELRNLELLKLRFGESQLHQCEVMLKDVADSKRCNAHVLSEKEKRRKEEEKRKEQEEKRAAEGGEEGAEVDGEEGAIRLGAVTGGGVERDKEKEENGGEQSEDAVDGGEDKENEEVNAPTLPSPDEMDFNTMILSAQFWPNLKEEKLEVPQDIKQWMETYTKSYEVLKGMRTLNWKTNLGQVTLDIELRDRTVTLTVSPIQATIIMHFQDKERWTIQELSEKMQVPGGAVRRKIAYWQSQGLLKEESHDTFVLVEEKEGAVQNQEMVMIDSDEEAESATASVEDQKEENLQMYWSFITGMLMNLESLPLERIHSMLKMFAIQGPSAAEFTENELRHLLETKVREQQLVYSAGTYRLPQQR
ncbi:anaphase-promoting complex subunit 2-like isoform X2 [Lytechinus variegatus]|uniref:anaphase-promoting complex subunit 2-like isoform X2 n=1 Tax=Lytechinus variegatus TaxID=7654 RepID=UPI001BB1582B|nr:anaphase-promoting complex subunit 2-like isoform X2 [Lytechinus variegatus]